MTWSVTFNCILLKLHKKSYYKLTHSWICEIMTYSIFERCYAGFTVQLMQQFTTLETTILIEMERSKDYFCFCLH